MSKKAFRIILFIFLFVVFPVYLTRFKSFMAPVYLAVFYPAVVAAGFFLIKKYLEIKYQLEYDLSQIEERMNVLTARNSRESKINSSLQLKISRYSRLKDIVEDLNQCLNLDEVCQKLARVAFSLIGDDRGNCLLYLIDNRTQRPALFKAIKEKDGLVIKAKEGDMLDMWVLRHASPLLVEDLKNDFRFDPERIMTDDSRLVLSSASAPFVSDRSLLGLLRLESQKPYSYSQDDLRFLSAICDLGAVAVENSQLYLKTRELAIHDPLTSLYTKGHFLQRLKDEAARSLRQKTSFCLLMLDIDFFKKYNDEFGHTAGDIVLKNISKAISAFFGAHKPFVSRFGGEEFCVILPELDKEEAYAAAEELRKRIEKEKIILRRKETHVSVSIGVAHFPGDARAEDELLQKADKAMYDAKLKGRNRVCRA